MRTSVTLALFVLLLLAGSTARASTCRQATFEQQLEAADVVFLGRATAQTGTGDATFEVERVFKGEVPKRILAHFFGVKYAFLPPPERYLVFGNIVPDEIEPGAGLVLTVRVCSGSVVAKDAAEILAKLGEGRPAGGRLGSAAAGPAVSPEATDDGIGAEAVDAGKVDAAPVVPPARPPSHGCAGCEVGRAGTGRAALWSVPFVALALARLARRLRRLRRCCR